AGEKRAFRDALRKRRCLVPADGFYEWRHDDARTRVPIWIHPEARGPITFAGLWERWKAPDGIWVITFTILTTGANALIEPLHDGWRGVLAARARGRWLEAAPLEQATVTDLFKPRELAGWRLTEVSTRVNNVKNDDPACLATPTEPPKPRQGSLF